MEKFDGIWENLNRIIKRVYIIFFCIFWSRSKLPQWNDVKSSRKYLNWKRISEKKGRKRLKTSRKNKRRQINLVYIINCILFRWISSNGSVKINLKNNSCQYIYTCCFGVDFRMCLLKITVQQEMFEKSLWMISCLIKFQTIIF